MADEFLPLEQARTKLAKLWFIGGGFFFLLMVVQSILGKHRGQLQEVWSWFLPLVLPSIALMLGVMAATALVTKKDTRRVKWTFFGFARGLTWFYFVTLGATIVLEPLSEEPGIALYTLSNYWLGPLQGLVVGVIGVLFAAQEQKEKQRGSE